MNLFYKALCAVALSVSFAAISKADPFPTISNTYQITSSDPTQLGRPSRNSIPQTWAHTESYPGVLLSSVTKSYYYQTETFAKGTFVGAPYLEISTFDPTNGTSYFLSAYENSYDPNDRSANWLGDVGFSGNYQLDDGGDFEVTLDPNSALVLVLNGTFAGTVPNYDFTVNVNAYGDTNYGDPVQVAATPEPSSLILAGTGLLGMAGAAYRRRFA